MPDNVNREAWPFYIALDVSRSMHAGDRDRAGNQQRTPWSAIADNLSDILFGLEESPMVADTVHLSVLAFADDVTTLLPLTRVASGINGLPSLPKGKQTNYAALFEHLHDTMAGDLDQLNATYAKVKRPAVFVVSDGEPFVGNERQPATEWRPWLDKLHALHVSRPPKPRTQGPERKLPVAVVAMGFGTSREETLRQLRQKPGIACVAEDDTADSRKLVEEILQSILDSVLDSATAGGDVQFRLPDGMRLL